MNDDKLSCIALVAGSVGMIITMSIHPTGHDLFVPGQEEHVARIGEIAHAIALVCLPITFLGAMGLTRRLGFATRLAIAALVFYGFGMVAILSAATVSGFVAPRVAHRILANADASATTSDAWRVAFNYNGSLNQAYALVFVVAASVALVLWSAAMLREKAVSRAAGVYGCIVAPLILLGVLVGHLRLDVHGFGIVVLSQAVWYAMVGVALWRGGGTSAGATTRTMA